MKILVMGASGMLGHQVCRTLARRMEIWATFQGDAVSYERYHLVEPDRALSRVNVQDLPTVTKAMEMVQPDAVVNAIGIVKQRKEAESAIPSIQVNALFPHQLAELCKAVDARLIHVSTDCVFSGKRGNYSETDFPDAADLYGRTKLLGELHDSDCLTIRTSLVGWELENRASLLEWFAAQRHRRITGYRQAIFTGLSTSVLAGLMGDILEDHVDVSGLYHVVSSPISKYDLLVKLRDALGWSDITIEPDDHFHCDRSLDGTRFQVKAGWVAPNWDEMVADLALDWPNYAKWRK
jgi:dTDP-4-dehydrorhamnose reductase